MSSDHVRISPLTGKPVRAMRKWKKDREKRNGVERPKPGGKCEKIWNLADEATRTTGTPLVRDIVAIRAEKIGIPVATALTQYGRWRKFHGVEGRQPVVRKVKPRAGSTEPLPAPITPPAIVPPVRKSAKPARK